MAIKVIARADGSVSFRVNELWDGFTAQVSNVVRPLAARSDDPRAARVDARHPTGDVHSLIELWPRHDVKTAELHDLVSTACAVAGGRLLDAFVVQEHLVIDRGP